MRWKIRKGGIFWDASGPAHTDSIELSGQGCSLVVRYGTDAQGRLLLERRAVFPTLRLSPNITEATFQCDLPPECTLRLAAGGPEQATGFFYNGVLTIESRIGCLRLTRTFIPDSEALGFWEELRVENTGSQPLPVRACTDDEIRPVYGRGAYGVYEVRAFCGVQQAALVPGGQAVFRAHTCARIWSRAWPQSPGWDEELRRRQARAQALQGQAILETGRAELDTLFRLCKLHAAETIFRTSAGPLHSPGGCEYYAATWTNDQVEYAGPWFALAGDSLAREAALNAYRQYIPFMGPQYTPIPTSVISQGQDIWEGAGDRGDAAMYLYGCSRFLLTLGDPAAAQEFVQPLLWCAEYCRRKTGADGLVCSDSDELEGRFPSGEANLSTNCLCYSGLQTAAAVLRELGREADARRLEEQRRQLGDAIERCFAARIHGFDTYCYYPGCRTLRAWNCWPLCAGLSGHAEGTVQALFSPALWSIQGMLCEEGDRTYWDRAALYAIRGAFAQGFVGRVWPQFLAYTENRLLGERAPYPIEAWPEGGMRHLSGESALYCRVVTEGLLGLEPLGFSSFALTLRRLPGISRWSLQGLRAFGGCFGVMVEGGECTVQVQGAPPVYIPAEQRSIIRLPAPI